MNKFTYRHNFICLVILSFLLTTTFNISGCSKKRENQHDNSSSKEFIFKHPIVTQLEATESLPALRVALEATPELEPDVTVASEIARYMGLIRLACGDSWPAAGGQFLFHGHMNQSKIIVDTYSPENDPLAICIVDELSKSPMDFLTEKQVQTLTLGIEVSPTLRGSN